MKKLSAFTVLSLLLMLMVLPSARLAAYDRGLLLEQTASLENNGNGDLADGLYYSGTLIPWFSAPVSETGKFYVSLGLTAEAKKNYGAFIPELLRTDFSRRIGNDRGFTAGRMLYSDPSGFILNGLLDGARFTADTGFGTFGIGIWYTGLLYKRNTQITMTNGDTDLCYGDLDYANFINTYFTSRRLIAALDLNNPHAADWLRLKLSLIGQFDLNGRNDIYHSQYLTAKGSVPYGDFIFNATACITTAQITKPGNDMQFKTGFAGELCCIWMLPTAVQDHLSFTGRFSGGTPDDTNFLTAFVPITTTPNGDILKAKLSGLSMLRLEYTAKPDESLILGLANSYFILSDLGTWQGQFAGRDGHFLGNEISGRVIWSPFSDLRITLEGGIFLPSLGNADSRADPFWRAELNAILVFF